MSLSQNILLDKINIQTDQLVSLRVQKLKCKIQN